jgi:hypothetical protein
MKMQVNENNLRPNILKDLLHPTVQIDMYNPKVMEDGIVVLFRVNANFDAAYDLSSFIEKLPFAIVDTEAQDIPDTDGYYNVFVEYERTSTFPEMLIKTINNIHLLSQTDFAALYQYQEVEHPLNEDTLKQFVRLSKIKDLREFFEDSTSNISVTSDGIIIKSSKYFDYALYESVRSVNDNEYTELLQSGWHTPSREQYNIFGIDYEVYKVPSGVLVSNAKTSLLFK